MGLTVSSAWDVAAQPGHEGNGVDGLLRIPRQAHGLSGFRRWALSAEVPEKLPISFLHGEVLIDMSKEEIRTHALVKTGMGGGLWQWNEEEDFGHLFINGVRVTNVEANVSNNPDLVLVSWQALESGRVRYIERKDRLLEIEGSPDAVMEIVSDDSVIKDVRELRQAYHRAGIREYWLVDARAEEIDFQILHWRKTRCVAATVKNGWSRSKVLNRWCLLSRKRDRSGAWKYTLSLRVESQS